MQLFKMKTSLHSFEGFADFAKTFELGKSDLVFTHRFLYEPFMEALGIEAKFIMLEEYGKGEPSDEMIDAVIDSLRGADYKRVIAVGGGTVIDVAKLFVLEGLNSALCAFEKTMPLKKSKELVIVPTTCGTGSEVTNISIAEIKSKNSKMGLADDILLADDAVIIPELLKGLPFPFYAASAIDALIHAIESYLSPKANLYTRLFSEAAWEIIIPVFQAIRKYGPEKRFESFGEMITASNFAGIAFGNAGVGAVHALSYPLGAKYHVPHGEANYQCFTEVFKMYSQKAPQGAIAELDQKLAALLNVSPEQVYEELDALLGSLIAKKPLREYGMVESDIAAFAKAVMETQGRLLANNYVPLSEEEVATIYNNIY